MSSKHDIAQRLWSTLNHRLRGCYDLILWFTHCELCSQWSPLLTTSRTQQWLSCPVHCIATCSRTVTQENYAATKCHGDNTTNHYINCCGINNNDKCNTPPYNTVCCTCVTQKPTKQQYPIVLNFTANYRFLMLFWRFESMHTNYCFEPC